MKMTHIEEERVGGSENPQKCNEFFEWAITLSYQFGVWVDLCCKSPFVLT